ncbi:MAG: isoprenyl transferase [Candidatus Scalindua sp.]|jgi:undecaprenyl diphosphate synthase|nr:isoprenyl transferase [Candidatus Scalindua sp.]MDV5166085.1 isoprenyl transferase [Candidatus Scalindua sp.]
MTNKKKLPNHIAIIMDGNGRWARKRGFMRVRGHEEGVNSVREITTECARKHIGQLTLYAFSNENWKRSKTEVNFLMRMLKKFLIAERKTIRDNDIILKTIGRTEALPDNVKKELSISIKESKNNKGMVLCLALNYGGRTEIIDATKKLAADVKKGVRKLKDIDDDVFKEYMYTANMPDPDLLIRTGGEMRVSNFLLWEVSYAELWFTSVYWPEFKKKHLEEALKDYAKRERRFGGLIE